MKTTPTAGAALAFLVSLSFCVLISSAHGQDGGGEAIGPAPAPKMTLTEAREFWIEGEYDRAIEAYQALTSESSQRLEAHLGLARCRLAVGRYEEAIADLASLDNGESAERLYLLGQLFRCVGSYEDVAANCRSAIQIDKNHAGARRLLGETLELLGRREEAVETYRWFDKQISERAELPRDAAWLTHAGIGFLRYSVLTRTSAADRTKHVLTHMLQPAYTRLDRTWWPARIAAGDLLREKFNNNEQDGSVSDYEAALRTNRNLPEAHVGLGEVALEVWNFEEAERRAEEALAVNPNHAGAIHLLAKKLLLERRYAQARGAGERALQVNPNDPIAMALCAAADACRYDQAAVEAMRARASAINPTCAPFHRILADALGGLRQYAASEKEYLRAIEFDPTEPNARTELGMMYMRWGSEDKARDVLEAAWALDPFNQRTKFTLELLESLEKFARHETAHFIVKYDPQKDPGLGEEFAAFLEEMYEGVTGDYAHVPQDKTIIEVFPTQSAFAVRITGKPWIHTVAACSGRIIAMAAPRRGPDLIGPYKFSRVLKHEFTHTVTLSATDNRIPHWFTEGLAVYQEDSPRTFEWCELLAEAARRDRLFTLESIDWGFGRPKHPNDRMMAYAQSEWMCEYIVERFGYDTINAMLQRYRRGQTQAEVFREQLAVDVAEFDRGFEAWARVQIGRWGFDLTPPEDATALREQAERDQSNADVFGRLARAEWDDDEDARAVAAARRALELEPRQKAGLEVLVMVLAEAARQEAGESARRAYEDEAISMAERLLEVDPGGRIAPKALGEILLRRKDLDRAFDALTRLQRACPMDPMSWSGLAGIYLDRKEDDKALPQLLELARTEEHDADVPKKIGDIYKRRGQLHDAQYWYRQALYIDPFSVRYHEALAETAMQAGDTAVALRSYRMLTKLDNGNVKRFEQAALAAHKLGDKDEASRLAARAVELDPRTSIRNLITPQPAAAP